MIARSLAVIMFVAGAALLVAGLALLGRGPGLPERTRHLRAMKDRAQSPREVRDVDMDFFIRLPHGAPLVERSQLERQGVRMEGWVQRILLSGDGDVHLEVIARPANPSDRDTVYVVAEVTRPWRERRRGWAYDSLLVAFRPNHGGATAWDAGTRLVRLTGWLLYDHQYDKRVTSWILEHGTGRTTGWEIHPVTDMELWDDASQSWRELAR